MIAHGRKTSQGIILGLLTIGALCMVIPMLSALAVALTPPTAPLTGRILFVPTHFYWRNFVSAWGELGMGPLLGNSAWVAIGTVIGQVGISTMAAFSISRLRMPGSRFLLYFFVTTMFLADTVILLPIFLVVRSLGLLNTLIGVVLPHLAWGLSVLFLVRYMDGIPRDFDEAARIDGASEWRILFRIIGPLSMPAIAVMMIETFVGTWNDFILPLVVISSTNKYTAALGLVELTGRNVGVLPQISMAATVTAMLPVLFIFLILQRYFVRAVSAGGVKA